ncbi:CidA/LrgA family protein [Rhizobium leguminosarum]|uniref:CidA/LrgA family protein n=2 Tax=Rhizobium leguminosarum TaxID=384 RepID=A0A154IMX5_RHILE|nr:CidA/LrgA family protein [Rhizobium leguminosarum]KZB01776.1 hypothetical protein A4A59_12100 [Rhizobium leguminosarum]
MLWGLFVLLACQVVGEAVAHITGLPLPGPVIGMLLLFCLLGLRDAIAPGTLQSVRDSVDTSAGLLLRNLSLLFIPAGVGLVQRYDLMAKHGVGLSLTVFISTVLTLAVTALVFCLVARTFSPAVQESKSR